MHWKKRFCSLLCLVALLGTLIFSALGTSGNSTVYLLAANDKFCDLPGGVLPLAVNGTIYIPYSTFDRNLTGVDLGVYYGITPEGGTVLTLYALSGMLTFTISANRCEDNLGNVMNFHAITRNGIPYVPASAVCNFFGLQYSFLPTTDRGTCIRITNPSSPHLDDGNFLTSAKGAMSTRYNQIIQSQSSQTVAPSATPAPTPTPTPVSSRPPVGSNSDVRVYLSLNASELDSDLTSLFPSGVYALFLFTPESLTEKAAQVRKVVAAGHSVGLLLSPDVNSETALKQLEQGNELLSHIARIKTRIVSVSGTPSSSLREALTREGWSFWSPSVRSAVTPSNVQDTLGTRPRTVRLDLSATRTGSIHRVINVLQNEGYDLRRTLETDL